MPRRKLRFIPTIALGVILLALAGLAHVRNSIASSRWDQAAQDQTIREAEPLIAAIHAYHARHTVYPVSLDKLTPEFLDTIPSPIVGTRRWTYSITSDGDYTLAAEPPFNNIKVLSDLHLYYQSESRTLTYTPSTRSWQLIDPQRPR